MNRPSEKRVWSGKYVWLKFFVLLACVGLIGPSHALAQGGPPVITSPPTDQTVRTNGTLGLNVAASSATAVSYQWFKDNVSLANGARISGVTTSNLTVAQVQSSDAGLYNVLVGNSS